MNTLVWFMCVTSSAAHLEFAQSIPGPRLSDQLPQDDAKAEDVTLCGHSSQGVIKALGSPVNQIVQAEE